MGSLSKRVQDITGFRNGKLVAVSLAGFNKRHAAIWNCRCDCGAMTTVVAVELKRRTHSCYACSRTVIHGMRKTEEYATWINLFFRCYNKKSENYSHYGGRGIKVCDRWTNGDGYKHPFECFLEDMGKRPTKEHSIDRIDVDGNYEPGNCRWATRDVQARNKRTAVK